MYAMLWYPPWSGILHTAIVTIQLEPSECAFRTRHAILPRNSNNLRSLAQSKVMATQIMAATKIGNRYLATSLSLPAQPLVGRQRNEQLWLNRWLKENMRQWNMWQRNWFGFNTFYETLECRSVTWKPSFATMRVPSYSRRIQHIMQRRNTSMFNSTLSGSMSRTGRLMWNIALQRICLRIWWRKDFLSKATKGYWDWWESEFVVNKVLCHHELRKLNAGTWKLRVGVKNYSIRMATCQGPVPEHLIFAISIAMWLRWRFNYCKSWWMRLWRIAIGIAV